MCINICQSLFIVFVQVSTKIARFHVCSPTIESLYSCIEKNSFYDLKIYEKLPQGRRSSTIQYALPISLKVKKKIFLKSVHACFLVKKKKELYFSEDTKIDASALTRTGIMWKSPQTNFVADYWITVRELLRISPKPTMTKHVNEFGSDRDTKNYFQAIVTCFSFGEIDLMSSWNEQPLAVGDRSPVFVTRQHATTISCIF